MKIALIYYSDMDFGGAERRLTRIYNEIGKSNYCDLIVRGCDKEELVARIKKADSGYEGFYNINCFKNNLQCLKYIIKKKYDVVHCFDTSGFNALLIIILAAIRCRTIFTIASVPIAERIKDGTASFNDIILVRFASVVDVLYPWCNDYLVRYRPKKKTKTTIGTFTDLDVFTPLAKDKMLVYAAARLENIKNPKLLVEACNYIQDYIREYGYKVIILGKGRLENELKEYIRNHDIQDIVEMPGYKKTSEYFPKAEAVFSLQRNENYPSQVIAEACACGCYLFITDVGSSRMCATERFCSFVGSKPETLGKAIEQYICLSEKEKNIIVQNARDYASENYTIDNSVKYYEKLLIND